MNIIKHILIISTALTMTACVGLNGIEAPLSDGQTAQNHANIRQFTCDNGFLVKVNYQNPNRIVVGFNYDGKTFLVPADHMASPSGNYYVYEKNTLRWHENNGVVQFTYPEKNYVSTKQLLQTTCRPR